jgi:hypothetical protein
MAPKKGSKASAEASLKRSIARRFNDALAATTSKIPKVSDQRRARKLNRFRDELQKGAKANGQPLTPLDIAARVNELLEQGVKLTELRKIVKVKFTGYDQETMVSLLKEMHPVYNYRPEAYRFAGVDNETLLASGIIDKIPAKRGPKPKKK